MHKCECWNNAFETNKPTIIPPIIGGKTDWYVEFHHDGGSLRRNDITTGAGIVSMPHKYRNSNAEYS